MNALLWQKTLYLESRVLKTPGAPTLPAWAATAELEKEVDGAVGLFLQEGSMHEDSQGVAKAAVHIQSSMHIPTYVYLYTCMRAFIYIYLSF